MNSTSCLGYKKHNHNRLYRWGRNYMLVAVWIRKNKAENGVQKLGVHWQLSEQVAQCTILAKNG